MKICTKCQIKQPLDNFAKDSRGRQGRRASCKTCHAAWMKRYNDEHAEENRVKQKVRDAARPKGIRHGITEERYQELKGKFDGKCWACKTNEATCIDHDHDCCSATYSCGNCVRGMLCRSCNMAYGLLAESPDRVKGLLDYVRLP